ncbi:Nif3-like dinuclear metal center hexameric protein [Carbonactinospora thermoautotrophica]|uniref:Nif3-like dinuclear metal center hexameric protein n=1 Tax=Carbonactinospora thermoautotrophica TaxID=1469144 RepID=UPI003DA992A2
MKLCDAIAVLDELYDPRWAEPWDAVGLVCGDPDAEVRRVLFAVDPVQAVAEEAVRTRADLVVVHHPLFLRPVHGVAATTPKGRVVHTLLTHGIALHVCHTNADSAAPGVSDALAAVLGLTVTGPLAPAADDPRRGIGRICTLPEPCTLAEFATRAARALPRTAGGLRVSGDPDLVVRTAAVSGGAGDSLFEHARAAGVDVFLTADLRHHPASEAREHGPPALIDAGHWATEWPWLAEAARLFEGRVARRGDTVETYVSHLVTDPWTMVALDRAAPSTAPSTAPLTEPLTEPTGPSTGSTS